MDIFLSPKFWVGLLVAGAVLVVAIARTRKELLNNTYVAVLLSLMIVLAYFHLVNHYLMDMQGLDYWYLFRK